MIKAGLYSNWKDAGQSSIGCGPTNVLGYGHGFPSAGLDRSNADWEFGE